MKLAVMQPYFFPYLGYFALIKKVDTFVLFDTPQFIRHGWIERNQVLKPNGEPLYIKVPLKRHKRETAINEIKIKDTEDWRKKIFAQLEPYKKVAPNYERVIELLYEIFKCETESLVEFNFYALKKTCKYLRISTPIQIWSSMNIDIDQVNAPDEWALNISKALYAKEYYNPEGGVSFFNRDKFKKEDIDLFFLKFQPKNYKQFTSDFTPFLSVIDVMMFNSKEKIQDLLENCNFF